MTECLVIGLFSEKVSSEVRRSRGRVSNSGPGQR